MQIFVFAVLCNLLPVILAQIEIINEDLGDLHFQANVGNLPAKYTPLTKQDQAASEKAAEFVDFIQLVPNLDPLKRAMLGPVGIDLPRLWFRGRVFLKNVVVAGIKNLIVHDVELRLKNLRTDLNVSIPLIYFEGEFNLQASFSILSLVFRCRISVNLLDVDVLISSGSRTAQAPPTGEVIQIDSASVNIDIGDVQYNVTDVVFGGDEEDVGEAITQLFKGKIEGNFYDGLLRSALNKANQQLLKVSTDVFKSYLFPEF